MSASTGYSKVWLRDKEGITLRLQNAAEVRPAFSPGTTYAGKRPAGAQTCRICIEGSLRFDRIQAPTPFVLRS